MNADQKKKYQEIIGRHPILKNFLEYKGQFATVKWKKQLQTYKKVESIVTKTGVLNCRAGIDYNERRSVIIGRILGDLPIENIGLQKNMAWELFPYIISTSTGKILTRLYPVDNHPPKYTYYLNNVEIDEETAKRLCVAKEFSEHNLKTGCINLTADYITEII